MTLSPAVVYILLIAILILVLFIAFGIRAVHNKLHEVHVDMLNDQILHKDDHSG